jgi:DNA-binding LacI/PurR family transcriptional regulator/transposase
MGRGPATPLGLRSGDEEVLVSAVRRAAPAVARRAGILLLAARGFSNTEIATMESTSRGTVIRWRARYESEGVDCLGDRPRGGRPPAADPQNIILRTLEPPPSSPAARSPRWTTRTLGAALGISASSVSRTWSLYGVSPARGGGVQLSSRPGLTVTDGTIVGLVLDPPRAVLAFAPGGTERGATRPSAAAPTRPTALSRAVREHAERLVDRSGSGSDAAREGERAPSADLELQGALEAFVRSGAHLVCSGTPPSTDGGGCSVIAAVDTFSQWLRVLDVLALVSHRSRSGAALGRAVSAVRAARPRDGALIWSDLDAEGGMEAERRVLRDGAGRPASESPDSSSGRAPHRADRGDGAPTSPRGERALAGGTGHAGDRVARRPIMSDVAARAGVSVKTVSNVLTGAKHVSAATRTRVEEAVGALDYQVHPAARQLRTGRPHAFVLALPELGLSYFAQLAEQVIATAAARGVGILVQTTGGRRERELEAIDMARHQADGLIIAAHGLREEDIRRASSTVPFVLLGEGVPQHRVAQITISNSDAASTAMQHLLRTGRRRIVLLGLAHRAVAEARVRGCRRAATMHGVQIDPTLLAPAPRWDRESGERAIHEVLDRGAHFDAVIGFNDELALGAQRALLSRGHDVPGDVALIGFDNSEDARYSTPSLSSVAPAFDAIADAALELVTGHGQRTPEERAGEPARQHITAPHRLVVRESTAGVMVRSHGGAL